jgi:hypothetical protein
MNCYSNFLYHFYNIDKKIDNWSIRVEDRKSWKLEHPLQCLRLQTRQFMADGKNRWLRPAPKSLVKYRKKCLIAMDKASFRGSDIPCFFFSWPWPNWDLELPCCRKASLWEIWWEPRSPVSPSQMLLQWLEWLRLLLQDFKRPRHWWRRPKLFSNAGHMARVVV